MSPNTLILVPHAADLELSQAPRLKGIQGWGLENLGVQRIALGGAGPLLLPPSMPELLHWVCTPSWSFPPPKILLQGVQRVLEIQEA